MIPDLRLTGGLVLRDGALRGDALSLAGGVVAEAGGRAVDCRGLWVLPGIVDLHGDGFERHVAPRRGALRDIGVGLASVEGELAANGITTAYLAQFWSWEGGMRSPEAAEALSEGLAGFAPLGTDLRVQLRIETHLRADWPRIEAHVARRGIRYAVFNDHLPHARLAAGRTPPRLTGQALKSGRSPEAHLALMRELHADDAEVQRGLPGFAARLAAAGLRLGSHDDREAAARGRWRAMGAGISEFPETLDAARAARDGGDGIVLGAPNVMRGGSHAGNVSARALIEEGLCDALASDYHYPAPVQAVLGLIGDGMDRGKAWSLVSEGPARLMGLADRGRLDRGARADVTVIDPEARRVLGTIAGGRITFAAGAFAARLAAMS